MLFADYDYKIDCENPFEYATVLSDHAYPQFEACYTGTGSVWGLSTRPIDDDTRAVTYLINTTDVDEPTVIKKTGNYTPYAIEIGPNLIKMIVVGPKTN